MTDRELSQELSNLQSIRAPKSLREKITASVNELPDMHRGFYFPLFAFQMAIVGIIFIILVGFGSGVVGASKAQPGTPLFPIKEMLHIVVPHMPEEHSPILSVPTPTPTVMPTSTPTPHQQVHMLGNDTGENKENFFQKAIQQIQDVKGAHTQQPRGKHQDQEEHQYQESK